MNDNAAASGRVVHRQRLGGVLNYTIARLREASIPRWRRTRQGRAQAHGQVSGTALAWWRRHELLRRDVDGMVAAPRRAAWHTRECPA
jgi:hypothetical protein